MKTAKRLYLREIASLCAASMIVCAASTAAQDNAAAPQSNEELAPRVPAIKPAEFDEALAIGGEEIDARKSSSRMTVEVRINETGPYKFVVDSGADTSVVGEKIAAKLGLPDAEPATLLGMTEIKQVERVSVEELQLGPTVTTDLDLPVLDERDIGGDGMIGLDALVNQRLMLDFEDKLITVEDSVEPVDFGRNVIVVTARLQRGQLILTQVRAQGKKVDAVIDTGTEVTIGNLAMRARILRRRPDAIKTIDIYGVTGATATLEFAVLRQLKLGPVEFRNVPIAFGEVPPFEAFGLTEEPALLLGTDLMEKFRRVSLDFRERKVRFQLKRCASRPTLIRTTTHASRISADLASAC